MVNLTRTDNPVSCKAAFLSVYRCAVAGGERKAQGKGSKRNIYLTQMVYRQ